MSPNIDPTGTSVPSASDVSADELGPHRHVVDHSLRSTFDGLGELGTVPIADEVRAAGPTCGRDGARATPVEVTFASGNQNPAFLS